MTSIVALIPARAGSKRIPGKNTKLLAGHPLIAYTIAAAQQSGVFDAVYVCTDSAEAGSLAGRLGASWYTRSASADDQPDIHWLLPVAHGVIGAATDAFTILRPTSPFRTAETIRRAWGLFETMSMGTGWALFDSLRAVEPVRQHPAKMWLMNGSLLQPLLLQPSGTPWHSSPTQTLPKVYVQNASLEMASTDTVRRTGTIAGERVLAFETHGYEGFDINTPEDWILAEALIERGLVALPDVG